MAKFGGAALKLFQTVLYAIEFCCAAIILGIYSYFLATLADRDAPITQWSKAVEGMSGAAVLYTIFAVLLTCCLGGKSFFAFIAIVLDILFCAAFVAIAVLTRDGAHSCSGYVRTPIGNGSSTRKDGFRDDNDNNVQYTYSVSLGTACRLNSACFAVAIVGAVLFLLSTIIQLALARHNKKEKRFGPSPANNYTSGRSNGFFARRRERKARNAGLRDPEVAAVPAAGGVGHTVRPSHDTAYTGSTVAGNGVYEPTHKPMTGGFHTAPTPAANY